MNCGKTVGFRCLQNRTKIVSGDRSGCRRISGVPAHRAGVAARALRSNSGRRHRADGGSLPRPARLLKPPAAPVPPAAPAARARPDAGPTLRPVATGSLRPVLPETAPERQARSTATSISSTGLRAQPTALVTQPQLRRLESARRR